VCVCRLSYPECNTHALYCHLLPLRIYYIFPYYLINGTIFEKTLIEVKCVFWSSVQPLFFLLQEELCEILLKLFIGLHVKYPAFLIEFYEIWIFTTDFLKISKYQIYWKSVQLFRAGRRMDGETNMKKLIAAFRNFANAPKHVPLEYHPSNYSSGTREPEGLMWQP